MIDLYPIITTSAAIEGSSLNEDEVRLLLDKGISSSGKTVSEQRFCLSLKAAYDQGYRLADSGEYISPFRIRELSSVALRDFGQEAAPMNGNDCLSRVCRIMGESRMHMNSLHPDELYRASFKIHFLLSTARPWGGGSDLMGRLMMHVLQRAAKLDPLVLYDTEEYRRILGIALSEDIEDIFVGYMLDYLHRPMKALKAFPPRTSSKDKILSLLSGHPRMTTADLARVIGISAKGVEKQLRGLKLSGRLKRLGPDKGGYWEVVQSEQVKE